MESARIVHVHEIVARPDEYRDGKVVRVLGRVSNYHAPTQMMTLEYHSCSLVVCVESLDGPSIPVVGMLIQCVGALKKSASSNGLVLDARFCRDMSTLNTDFFDRSLTVYRRMLSQSPYS